MPETKNPFKPVGAGFLQDLGEESWTYLKTIVDDVTEMMVVAKKLADHTNQFENKVMEQTGKLNIHIEKLEKEVRDLKKIK